MVCRLLLSYKLQGEIFLILKIQSFAEGRGTLFTCVPILVYTYKEFVLYMEYKVLTEKYMHLCPIGLSSPKKKKRK